MEMWHWEHTKHVHHQLSDLPAGFSNLPLIPAATEDLLKKILLRPGPLDGQGKEGPKLVWAQAKLISGGSKRPAVSTPMLV